MIESERYRKIFMLSHWDSEKYPGIFSWVQYERWLRIHQNLFKNNKKYITFLTYLRKLPSDINL